MTDYAGPITTYLRQHTHTWLTVREIAAGVSLSRDIVRKALPHVPGLESKQGRRTGKAPPGLGSVKNTHGYKVRVFRLSVR